MSRKRKTVLSALVLVALAIGVTALISSQAAAFGPVGGPQCGPHYRWSCSGPGGPDVLFFGTVCDKLVFEQQTGLTCTAF